ncbi:hypothetical protein NESM_000851400 [Novymonas esmeraldas]|uniref:HD/PDEase domain-containing protein n=1 Tax=Novymonas esmeraldas TaxID=1808958 RepID=A0AAW0F0W6_9TRYP
MEEVHRALWTRCTAFVAAACAGRDASHGLAHMRQVTEQAILLYLMDASSSVAPGERSGMLYRLILVGMLHDVADHKYDVDGTLHHRVSAFIAAEAAALVAHATDADPSTFSIPLPGGHTSEQEAGVARLLLTSLDAISYSKEVKRGMRWFVSALSDGSVEAASATSSWVAVRDYVSDSDKLEAIGSEGLLRCYEYTCARFRAAAAAAAAAHVQAPPPQHQTTSIAEMEKQLETVLLREVVDHFHDKLVRLLPLFIVTSAGKYLGAPRAAEMAAALAEWQLQGPPPVATYWRNAAVEYTPV